MWGGRLAPITHPGISTTIATANSVIGPSTLAGHKGEPPTKTPSSPSYTNVSCRSRAPAAISRPRHGDGRLARIRNRANHQFAIHPPFLGPQHAYREVMQVDSEPDLEALVFGCVRPFQMQSF